MSIQTAVQEQLERIHKSVNDGTLDKDTINHAIKAIADIVSGGKKEAAIASEAEKPEPKRRGRPKQKK